jgi:SAM-dependent methyltransferase
MPDRLAEEWNRILAPQSRDVRAELVGEAAEFLGIPIDEAWGRMCGAAERFCDEWARTVDSPNDEAALARFYNHSDAELFELIEWHATDPIHYRTIILRDRYTGANGAAGRSYLDYGSGIGNDALVFGDAGFEITLADISELLLAFAAWRCRRRGFAVRTIDLRREAVPVDRFDLAVCFDVLEHIPKPLDIVRRLRAAVRPGGWLVIHAPFGADPEHPMHVVHRDVVTPRMRSLGFQPVGCEFPPSVRAPQIYQKRTVAAMDRAAYYVYDRYLSNPVGARLAKLYRRTFRGDAALAGQRAGSRAPST